MASSGSEDEKILKSQEKLENVNRKLAALRQEQERLEPYKARLEEKIQTLSYTQQRTNSEKRKGVHLSLPPPHLPPYNEGKHARSMTVDEGPRKTPIAASVFPAYGSTQPHRENIGPAAHRNTAKTKQGGVATIPEEGDTGADGQSDEDDGVSDRSINGSYAVNLQDAQRSPPAYKKPPVTSPTSGSLLIDHSNLHSPNFVPTSMPEAQRMKEKLDKMQGFMHYVSFIGILPNSLAFQGLTWPHPGKGQEIGRLVDMIIDHRTNGCTCVHSSTDPMPSYRISNPARSYRPCSIEQRFKMGVSSFVAMAHLGGVDVTKLYEVWQIIMQPIWIPTYVVKIDRHRVGVAVGLVVTTLEEEVARMPPKATQSTKMI